MAMRIVVRMKDEDGRMKEKEKAAPATASLSSFILHFILLSTLL
jgi:hypothetical protein